jgi:hypothetical protein
LSFFAQKNNFSETAARIGLIEWRDNALLCGEQETIGGARLTFRNLAAARRKSELYLRWGGGGRACKCVRKRRRFLHRPRAPIYALLSLFLLLAAAPPRESKWRKISAVISHYHVNQADSFAAIQCSLFSLAAIGFFSSAHLFIRSVRCLLFCQ